MFSFDTQQSSSSMFTHSEYRETLGLPLLLDRSFEQMWFIYCGSRFAKSCNTRLDCKHYQLKNKYTSCIFMQFYFLVTEAL